MEGISYNPVSSADSLSNFTAVLSGFALAGFFLLVERSSQSSNSQLNTYRNTMLLLFISFLTGSITAFMYASVAGYAGQADSLNLIKEGIYTAIFPHNTLVITVAVLLCGLSMVVSAFGTENNLRLSRRVVYVVVYFCVLRLLVNQ